MGLTLRGQRINGKPTVLSSSTAEVQVALRDLLIVSPRDAAYAGVGFDTDGQPNVADIVAARKSMVLIVIEIPE